MRRHCGGEAERRSVVAFQAQCARARAKCVSAPKYCQKSISTISRWASSPTSRRGRQLCNRSQAIVVSDVARPCTGTRTDSAFKLGGTRHSLMARQYSATGSRMRHTMCRHASQAATFAGQRFTRCADARVACSADLNKCKYSSLVLAHRAKIEAASSPMGVFCKENDVWPARDSSFHMDHKERVD